MKLNKENGITLVALMVTIIVLIILAAVSVMIIMDNNIVEVTTNGTEKYYEKQIEEYNKMESIDRRVDSIVEVLKDI